MQLDIQTNGFLLTDGIKGYTERRLRFALGRYDARITRASVRLSDINGPRGGEDKRCHIDLNLVGINSIVIEDTEADLYVAIDRACERCARTLNRRLARTRDIRYQTRRLPAPE